MNIVAEELSILYSSLFKFYILVNNIYLFSECTKSCTNTIIRTNMYLKSKKKKIQLAYIGFHLWVYISRVFDASVYHKRLLGVTSATYNYFHYRVICGIFCLLISELFGP